VPEIIPDHVPSPRTPLVWDGTRYRAVRGYTDGTVQVRGEDQLFSIDEPWLERQADTNATVDSDSLQSSAVGAGDYRILTHVAAFDVTSNITRIDVYASNGVIYVHLGSHFPTAAYHPFTWDGWIPLPVDWYVKADFTGTVAGDDIYLDTAGFQMTVE